MRTIYVPFTYSDFKLVFEDDSLADSFGNVFQALPCPDKDADNTIVIHGSSKDGYSVSLNGRRIKDALTSSEAAFCVTRIFGDNICAHADTSIRILHAASVLLGDEIIAFSGVSGSGKTTLSLLFSKYGSFVGDEYAYLNIDSGSLWHERHPYQLKNGNTDMLERIDPESLLAVEGEPFGRAYYVSLKSINHTEVKQSDNRRLSILVFPHFDKSLNSTTIAKLPPTRLPDAILQSLMGCERPSLLFGKFIRMAGREAVRMLEINYSDGDDAATTLFEYLRQQKG